MSQFGRKRPEQLGRPHWRSGLVQVDLDCAVEYRSVDAGAGSAGQYDEIMQIKINGSKKQPAQAPGAAPVVAPVLGKQAAPSLTS